MPQHQPAVILDFDGTIADNFPMVVEIAHDLLGKRLAKDDISRLRGLTGLELLRALHIPLWRAWFIVARIRRRMRRRVTEIAMIPGMDRAIRTLARDHTLFVLSANSPDNVQAFLRHHGIEQCFTRVYGGVAPWRKARALKRLLRSWRFDPDKTWYVGDTDLDIAAARRARVHVAAVAWGFSNIHVLERHHPDALVFTADELLQVVSGKAGDHA